MSLTHKALVAFLVFGGAIGAGTERGSQVGPARGGVEREAVEREALEAPPLEAADCPYFPQHEHLFIANPTREWNRVHRLTTQVAASLPERVVPLAAKPKNLIDQYIFAKMNKDRVPAAPLSTDEEFVRRVYLDLTGRIPSGNDVRQFLTDIYPAKRERLVDSLIGKEEYVDKWTMFFGDLLKNVINSTQINLYADGRNAFHRAIREALQDNVPYNEFVKALISATGDNYYDGAVNFIVRWRQGNGPIQDTYDNLAAAVGTQFLGLSLECLSCHSGAGHTNTINLFLTSKSRYEFWGTAAFFSRVRFQAQRQENRSVKYLITEATTGNYLLNTTTGNKTPRQPESGQPNFVAPAFLFNGKGPEQGESYRQALGRLVTSDRQFARATVNYVWKELFGLGLVEPEENFDLIRMDPSNPPPQPWALQPTHPELLEALAIDFESSGYNLQHLLKRIVNSTTYQLSSRYPGQWKEAYVPYFARKFPRRLMAEEIHDAIVKAAGVPTSYRVNGLAEPLAWAMQMPDPTEPRAASRAFLDAFLRGNRDSQPRSSEGSIPQALSLMNDAFVITRIRASNPNTTVAKILAKRRPAPEMVEELYLSTLSRFPTAQELLKGTAYVNSGTASRKLEDLQFALMNKVDFIFNY